LKETLHPFSVMRILVSKTTSLTIAIAGLTVGDPVLRTGNPLSVELGPGKLSKSY
jgi:V-type H+-transporting ATPase subunit A